MTTFFIIATILGVSVWAACVPKTKRVPRDEHDLQAEIDQKTASYPGCKMGYMDCVALCDCGGATVPRNRWLTARAARLRAGEDERGDTRRTAGNIPDFGRY